MPQSDGATIKPIIYLCIYLSIYHLSIIYYLSIDVFIYYLTIIYLSVYLSDTVNRAGQIGRAHV